jgi:hypothetical protein
LQNRFVSEGDRLFVVPLLESWAFGEYDGKHCVLAMPFYANGTLTDKLREQERTFTQADVEAWMERGLTILEWLHKQCRVVHGDAHTGNFLLVGEQSVGVAARAACDAPPLGTPPASQSLLTHHSQPLGSSSSPPRLRHLLLFDFDESWRRDSFLEPENFDVLARIDRAKFLDDIVSELSDHGHASLTSPVHARFQQLFGDELALMRSRTAVGASASSSSPARSSLHSSIPLTTRVVRHLRHSVLSSSGHRPRTLQMRDGLCLF